MPVNSEINKFKIGDIVEATCTRDNGPYSITVKPWRGEVCKVNNDWIKVLGIGKYKKINIYDKEGFRVESKYFKLVQPKKLVQIIDNKTQCCTCEECFEEVDIVDDEAYCFDCRVDKFIICEECGEYHPIEDCIVAQDHYFCGIECANEKDYFKCKDCNIWTKGDRYRDNHGNFICEDCSSNYYICDVCSTTVHSRDIYYNVSSDENFCPDCCREHVFASNEIIKKYDFKPRQFVYDKMAWENTIYLGIELEVESSNDRDGDADKVNKWLVKNGLDKRVYIKEDGSLDYGFEIVIHPTTLQALHNNFPMKKFLEYLSKIGLESHEPGTCGLHVHISKESLPTSKKKWRLTNHHLLAGKLFFYKCEKYISTFSGRDDFEYCKFDDDMPTSGSSQQCGRYSAFNTSTLCPTVEIRVFRGTLDYERFLASLQFSDCFANYIQKTSVAYLKKASGADIWASFLDYAKKHSLYGQFLKYVKKEGIV